MNLPRVFRLQPHGSDQSDIRCWAKMLLVPLVQQLHQGTFGVADTGTEDVLLKDVGGLRAEDGRWPFVIDPSGRTSTFIKYSGAAAALPQVTTEAFASKPHKATRPTECHRGL